MPGLVPTSPDDPATEANRAAWRRLSEWDKPFLVAFSDRDPITGAMAPVLKRTVPGAAGIEHPVIEGAGHFLQEDAGERLGTVIAGFVTDHRPGSLLAGAAAVVRVVLRRVARRRAYLRPAPVHRTAGPAVLTGSHPSAVTTGLKAGTGGQPGSRLPECRLR